MDTVKGEPIEAFDRSIDVHVSRIRAAIEDDPKKPRRVITIRGTGYVFAKAQDSADLAPMALCGSGAHRRASSRHAFLRRFHTRLPAMGGCTRLARIARKGGKHVKLVTHSPLEHTMGTNPGEPPRRRV
jgi:hypothetical protein